MSIRRVLPVFVVDASSLKGDAVPSTGPWPSTDRDVVLSNLHSNTLTLFSAVRIIMPPPRGHNAVIGVRRPSVCLSVRLMSRISALTRKPKGLGRRNFAPGYPRSHATPTPTSRSKGQKSRSRGGGILWRARRELPPGERLQI